MTTLRIRLLLSRLLFATPAVERRWRDQRDQLFYRLAQRLAEFHEPRPLMRLRVDLTGDSRPQNLVLFLQEFDILREFVVVRRGDQRQQWVEDFGGRAIVGTRY